MTAKTEFAANEEKVNEHKISDYFAIKKPLKHLLICRIWKDTCIQYFHLVLAQLRHKIELVANDAPSCQYAWHAFDTLKTLCEKTL